MEYAEIKNFFDTEKAACKGVDITIFFPSFGSRYMFNTMNQLKKTQEARQICKTCSVIDGCLEYSLHFEPLGVWGGKSEVEREVLRQQKNIHLPIERTSSQSVRRSVRAGRVGQMVNRLGSINE